MGWQLHGKGYQCVGRQARGLQSARAHAKCAGPRKVRGPTQSARAYAKCAGCVMSAGDGKCVDVRAIEPRPTHFAAKCVGRGSIARAALSARATIAWRGEWAALPTHLPRTCHSMPTQCNRGSTRVGRDEPQSPGMLRVKHVMHIFWIYWPWRIWNIFSPVSRKYSKWPKESSRIS